MLERIKFAETFVAGTVVDVTESYIVHDNEAPLRQYTFYEEGDRPSGEFIAKLDRPYRPTWYLYAGNYYSSATSNILPIRTVS